jgi:Mn-dependent DtxR family transcriptional regulator
MNVTESSQMYLETILVLSKKGPVRSIDIANEMEFSRPTISIAIHNLQKEGYLKIAEDGTILLEPSGQEIAETIYERHTTLTEIFKLIGVKEEIASDDACKIEHDLSPETFTAIKKAYKKYKKYLNTK